MACNEENRLLRTHFCDDDDDDVDDDNDNDNHCVGDNNDGGGSVFLFNTRRNVSIT